jgi:hypothetical protein
MRPVDFLWFWNLSLLDRTPRGGESGQTVTACWLAKWPLKSNEQYLNRDTWQPSGRLGSSDRMLGLRPINPTSSSGQVEQYPFVLLTALFFVGAYTYVLAGSRGSLSDFWSSSHPLELSILPPTHLSCLVANLKWDWVISSDLLVSLHLVALGDRLWVAGFLLLLVVVAS